MLQNDCRKNKFGVVVIGRNEGVRLKNCLASVINQAKQVVYVDSGSTDDSVNVARDMGVSVVELDMSIPFTAARARNEGVSRLRELTLEIAYIQFVDGDCEVVEGWFDQAVNFLDRHTDIAVVCGRRRERFPEYSIYNLMCDIEWNTPIGEAKACGGDAMMRVDAFIALGGFRASLIAGEEPELCVRLRAAGWKIWRLDVEMSHHDAAMSKFSQWWKRAMRGGYAYAEGAFLHGISPEHHRVRESLSAWCWGGAVPAIVLFSMMLYGVWGAVLALVYPAQVIRLTLRDRKYSPTPWGRALFLVLGKFPEMLGQLKFAYSRLLGKSSRLIEYK